MISSTIRRINGRTLNADGLEVGLVLKPTYRSMRVSNTGGVEFSTLTDAKNYATSGDLITVLPGVYNENNLLKDGVNWHFMPGARVEYTLPQCALGVIDPTGSANSITFVAKVAGAVNNGLLIQYIDDGSQVGNTAVASWSLATNTLTVKVKSGTSTAFVVSNAVNGLSGTPVTCGATGSAGGNLLGTVTAPLSVALAGGSGVVTSTSDYGIFDDRDGAVNCTIGGNGVFKCIDGLKNSDLVATVNTNAKGTIYVKQAGTNIIIHGNEVMSDAWLVGVTQIIRVENCGYADIVFSKITDLNNGLQATDTANGVGADNTLNGAGIGCFWTNGETYLTFDRCVGGAYGIWAGQNVDGAANTNLWVTGNQVKSATASIYWSEGPSVNWRTWVHVKEAISGTGNLNFISGGKHYMVIDKISSTGIGTSVIISNYLTNVITVWLNAQKISYGASIAGYAISFASTKVVFHGEVLQFEDTGGISGSAAINVQASDVTTEVHLTGGYAKVLNGKGINMTTACNMEVNGMKIDTTNTNSASNNPISVAAAGLKIRNCVLLAPATADSVTAGSAQTITNYGSVANKAKNANVTVNVSALIVDVNVV